MIDAGEDLRWNRRIFADQDRYDIHVKLECPLLKSVESSFFSTLSLNFLRNFVRTLEELLL